MTSQPLSTHISQRSTTRCPASSRLCMSPGRLLWTTTGRRSVTSTSWPSVAPGRRVMSLSRSGRSIACRDPSVDVLYATREDLGRDPSGLSLSCSLGGEFRSEGAFEANPVAWRVLSKRAIAVRAARLDERDVWFDADVLRRWNVANLDSYWSEWLQRARAEVATEARVRHEYGMQWLVLGVPRLHYTIATLEVTSKTGAGRYALEVAPTQWHRVLEAAISFAPTSKRTCSRHRTCCGVMRSTCRRGSSRTRTGSSKRRTNRRERVERGACSRFEGVLSSRAERGLVRGGREGCDAVFDVAVARVDLPWLVAHSAACDEVRRLRRGARLRSRRGRFGRRWRRRPRARERCTRGCRSERTARRLRRRTRPRQRAHPGRRR